MADGKRSEGRKPSNFGGEGKGQPEGTTVEESAIQIQNEGCIRIIDEKETRTPAQPTTERMILLHPNHIQNEQIFIYRLFFKWKIIKEYFTTLNLPYDGSQSSGCSAPLVLRNILNPWVCSVYKK